MTLSLQAKTAKRGGAFFSIREIGFSLLRLLTDATDLSLVEV